MAGKHAARAGTRDAAQHEFLGCDKKGGRPAPNAVRHRPLEGNVRLFEPHGRTP